MRALPRTLTTWATRTGDLRGRAAIGIVGLGLTAGCGSGVDLSLELAYDSESPDIGKGDGSFAKWLDEELVLPQSTLLRMKAFDTGDYAQQVSGFGTPSGVDLKEADVTLAPEIDACEVTSAVACTGGECSVVLRFSAMGLCLVKANVTTADGDTVAACWHGAFFVGQDQKAEQQATVDAAVKTCEDGL